MPKKKELYVSGLSVCLLVCPPDFSESYERIWRNFLRPLVPSDYMSVTLSRDVVETWLLETETETSQYPDRTRDKKKLFTKIVSQYYKQCIISNIVSNIVRMQLIL